MGYLRNRGTKNAPNWYARFKDSDGKWKERPTRQPTKEAARRFVAELEARVSRGAIGMPEASPEDLARKALTVGELARRFLGDVDGAAGYTTPKIKDIKVYRSQARTTFKCRILPTLGARAAASVTLDDAKRLRDEQLAAGLKPGSVAQTLAALSRLFTWARSAGLVECGNPVAGCERLRSAESLDFLDRAEVGALLAFVEALAIAHGATWEARVLAPMVSTAVHCGLRKGELFGLRWRDMDLDAGRLTVARSYRGLPKSGLIRHVPIHPDLSRVLRRWLDRCPRVEDGLVFPVEAGPGRFRMGYKKDSLGIVPALVAAGCRLPTDGKYWHMLRHSFAAHAVMSGASLYAVQRLLGHSSPQMTQRYAHLAPDFMASEVARMSFAPAAPEGVADLGEARRRRAMDRKAE